MKRYLVAVVMGAAVITVPRLSTRAAPNGLPGVPSLVYWAWERPENLRGLSNTTGVAYLAATVRLSGESFQVVRRHQPLQVDPDTPLVAVVRLETVKNGNLTLTGELAGQLAPEIAALRRQRGVRAVQIDFDATLSERSFYRELLSRTRAELGAFPLSITALASWCMADDWLRDLPIDEAVPMLFRLGSDDRPFIAAGMAGGFSSPVCGRALGISTDEPISPLPRSRRTYVFSPKAWTSDSLRRVRAEVPQ